VKDGEYTCFECKFSEKKGWSLPNKFRETYPTSTYTIINPTTIADYIR
jgi:hypothetical protein